MLNPEKLRPVLGGQYLTKNRGHFELNIQLELIRYSFSLTAYQKYKCFAILPK